MVIPVTKPEVSSKEKKYREELFPDIKDIKNKNLLCTSCGSSVKDLITKGKPISHPFLETLLCEKCHAFYGDGEFSVDEDGSDKYCRWCGQGGTLFLCSQCTSGFCKKCVKRNLPKSALAKIEEDDWVCYCCDTAPLYELRAQCWAAQQYAAEHVKAKGSSKGGSKRRESSKRPRDAENGESEEENESKKKRKVDLKLKGDKKQKNSNEKVSGSERDRERGRSLRRRNRAAHSIDSGGESETNSPEDILPSGIRVKRIRAAISKLTVFVADIAGMTKEAHKKLLECKKKKLNIRNINTIESVVDTQTKFSSMVNSLETNIQMVRKGLEEYIEEWTKMVQQDMEMSKDEDAKLENGILPEEADGNRKQSEAMEVDNEIQKADSGDVETNIDPKKDFKEETVLETDKEESIQPISLNDSEKIAIKIHEEGDSAATDLLMKDSEKFEESVSDKERISLVKDVNEEKSKEDEKENNNKKVNLKEGNEEKSEEKSSTGEALSMKEKESSLIKES